MRREAALKPPAALQAFEFFHFLWSRCLNTRETYVFPAAVGFFSESVVVFRSFPGDPWAFQPIRSDTSRSFPGDRWVLSELQAPDQDADQRKRSGLRGLAEIDAVKPGDPVDLWAEGWRLEVGQKVRKIWPCFGADEHTCTTYFDVHQGYRDLKTIEVGREMGP